MVLRLRAADADHHRLCQCSLAEHIFCLMEMSLWTESAFHGATYICIFAHELLSPETEPLYAKHPAPGP